MITDYVASKELIKPKNRDLAAIFGDVIISSTDQGCTARFANDVVRPIHGGSNISYQGVSMDEHRKTPCEAANRLFKLIRKSKDGVFFVKEQQLKLHTLSPRNLTSEPIRHQGYAEVNLPRLK